MDSKLTGWRDTIEFLTRASEAYYGGVPFISDEQFDSLATKVDFSGVGATPTGKTATHFKRMYSLQKFYEDEGATNPLEGISNISYTPKLDGAALGLLYQDGILVQALTRGDGITGQVVTKKLYYGKTVPLSINGLKIKNFQVTGEVVASKEIENSRNYAAGALNLNSMEEFRTRAVTFVAYDCYPHLTDTYDSDMELLSRMGFFTIKDPDLDKIYPTDGIVYRVNDHTVADDMGYTSKYPRFAYARKERQDCVETEIIDVEWNTGRTGRVTPVAILKPVMIDGKEVSRATLNNPGFIESLGLCIGDTVAVRLAGMIIPEVVYKVDA